jgi:hypothetical protein
MTIIERSYTPVNYYRSANYPKMTREYLRVNSCPCFVGGSLHAGMLTRRFVRFLADYNAHVATFRLVP